MTADAERYFHNIISGAQAGGKAAVLRGALSFAEPFYAGVVSLRNRLYDGKMLGVTRLSFPTISVGNLTAGGTGKTPMVRLLASQLRKRGRQVAVLSRGYKSVPGQLGDEQRMLDMMLNGSGYEPVTIVANPDRIGGAAFAIQKNPKVDLFLLDDGFQHRRIARDVDIVLLNATEPFGHGHVLPRGLLREPISGLTRASAVVITHADEVDALTLAKIERHVRRYQSTAPIFAAAHRPLGLRTSACLTLQPPDRSLDDLREKRFFAFCGIGNPRTFHRRLESLGAGYVGNRWFSDHHAYTAEDMAAVAALAAAKNANVLVTTEKDWAKVCELRLALPPGLEILRLDVAMSILNNRESELIDLVVRKIE